MTRLSQAFGRLFDALAFLAALILRAMVAIVTADIVLRNVGSGGFAWANAGRAGASAQRTRSA